jgi:AraC-like DNA-binding protein
MPFDHATIVTEDLESARRFLCAIVGLSEGPRPGFGVGGHWLYANGQPVIHLIEKPAASSAISAFGPTDPVELRVNPLGTLSRLAQQGLERHRLSRVLDYIDANLEGELTLDRLAGIACLSRFHFARAFKAAVGQSPHQHVSAKRLERAKELLIRGNQSLIDIALTLSFSCQASFTRAFRQATGLTPGQYRRSFRASDGSG